MTEQDYPNIFTTADGASKEAQNRYVRLNISILSLIVLTTISTFVSDAPKWLSIFSSILLVISTILTVFIFFFKPEKVWYDGRAIAESAKSLTWKFMMGVSPFSFSLTTEKAEEKLLKNLKQIIGQKKEFYKLIGEQFGEREQITPTMIAIREKSFLDKVQFYSLARLEEQRKWYSKKSKLNRTNKNIALSCLIAFQLFAIIALVMEIYDSIEFTLTPLFATLATSTIALLQLKRFQELTESYGITATELSLINSKTSHIKDEEDLENFVNDAETAISREHTLWLARRDSVELFK